MDARAEEQMVSLELATGGCPMIMMVKSAKSLDQVLDSLDRATLLGLISYAQRRMNRDAVILDLLQSRLRHLTSRPAKSQDDELMTAKDVGKLLRVSTARAHELIRTQVIPSVRL